MSLKQPVIVERAPADKPGPDITSPLFTDENMAIARGTAEIDYNSSSRIMASMTASLIDWVAPGSIVHVTDHENVAYRGMVDRIAVTISRAADGKMTVNSHLVIEREL